MTQDVGGDKVYVEAVLNRHAQKLLSTYRLHDLAFFAANLQDYELVGWLRKERYVNFYRRDAMLVRVVAIAMCLSVCLSRAGIVSKRRKLLS